MKCRALWLSIGWLMVAVVVYVSLTPSPPPTPAFDGADKVLHGLAYVVLMGWFGQLYASGGGRVLVAVALVGMGVGLEMLQGFGGIRTASWTDGVADAAGVIGGCLALRTRLNAGLFWLDSRLRRLIGA
ncbi:MAG: hypothetical protein MAG794_00335 [Gammaproteobacteria bacterium]|nr:hypothetical protein [Gammaproteobacteria bacterium]